jgi:BED zinc finger
MPAYIVWNYFNYDETKNKVNCRECKCELCYNRNTSAMREHLKCKHVHVNFAKLADGEACMH